MVEFSGVAINIKWLYTIKIYTNSRNGSAELRVTLFTGDNHFDNLSFEYPNQKIAREAYDRLMGDIRRKENQIYNNK